MDVMKKCRYCHKYYPESYFGVALTTSKKMISGYEKDKPTEGYITRAWARTALKNMTKSLYATLNYIASLFQRHIT